MKNEGQIRNYIAELERQEKGFQDDPIACLQLGAMIEALQWVLGTPLIHNGTNESDQ